jgi:hypothetical protein
VAVTVGCTRPSVNHCYIKVRLRGTSDPPRVYIEAQKPHFKRQFSFLILRSTRAKPEFEVISDNKEMLGFVV